MFSRFKVSTKLLGVIGMVVVAATAAVGLYVFHGAEETIAAQTRAQLATERDSRARLVTAYLRRIHDQLGISSRQLVTQIAISQMPAAARGSSNEQRLQELFHPYARGLAEAFGYHDVVLIGSDGRVLYSFADDANRGTAPVATSGEALAFAQAKSAASGTIHFIDYTIEAASSAPAAFAATPVFDTETNKRLGVLVFTLSVDELSAIMTDAAGFGSSGETYLLGPDLLMRSNTRFARDPLKLSIQTPAGRRALAGESGTLEQSDYRGVPVFAAYAPLDALGARWAIVVKTDVDEALAPIRLFRTRALLLFALVGLVAGVVLFEALRRIVLSPVSALTEGARRVAARDYTRPVGMRSGDELGELGQSFDQMMAAVDSQVEELKRARAAAQLGQQLLEAAPDGVVVANASGRITMINAAAERLFGYSRDELAGQFIETLVPDASKAGHVGRRDGYLSAPTTRGMGSGLELVGRRKDGSLVPVEISLSPFDGPDGRLVVAAVRDISDRRDAERNLKESEERLAAAARGANLGLWDIDARQYGGMVNEIYESQLGYPPQSLREGTGRWAKMRGGLERFVELLHPDDRPRVAEEIERFLSGGVEVYRTEQRLVRPDGTYTWILSVGNSVDRDEAGRPMRVNGVHIDISEMKDLQRNLEERYEELQQLQQLRDGLVHMIVHDLRSPLNSVLGYVDLLRTETDSPAEERTRFLNYAYDGANQMIELISSLLDINRLEANEMPLDRQVVDLGAIASEAVTSLGGLTVGREVAQASTEGAIQSNCDPALIRRVIANLLGNALKFTPESGSITITVSRKDGQPRVEVADTGPGIPADFLGRVFDKFSQAGEGRARKRYSTGLGLAFCKLAVEAHGGAIGVTSEVGKGSRFFFQLPS